MLTPDQQLAYESIVKNQIVFISGPAGTGKSYLIHYLQDEYKKEERNCITLSSTGISAHHIQGMTVHSFLCRLKLKHIQITDKTVFIFLRNKEFILSLLSLVNFPILIFDKNV